MENHNYKFIHKKLFYLKNTLIQLNNLIFELIQNFAFETVNVISICNMLKLLKYYKFTAQCIKKIK